MSDDLTPAEQARAARWAADWLERGFDDEHPVTALHAYADKLDPPETVESLRAERDNALTNARTWEDLADGWRDRAIELRGDVREAKDTIARLRSTHVEAEAAWERCKRRPVDAEPGKPLTYQQVLDNAATFWGDLADGNRDES